MLNSACSPFGINSPAKRLVIVCTLYCLTCLDGYGAVVHSADNKQTGAGAVIIAQHPEDKDFYVLLALERDNLSSGFDSFGGKSLDGETPVQTAIRETAEETRLTYNFVGQEQTLIAIPKLDGSASDSFIAFAPFMESAANIESQFVHSEDSSHSMQSSPFMERHSFQWIKFSKLMEQIKSNEENGDPIAIKTPKISKHTADLYAKFGFPEQPSAGSSLPLNLDFCNRLRQAEELVRKKINQNLIPGSDRQLTHRRPIATKPVQHSQPVSFNLSVISEGRSTVLVAVGNPTCPCHSSNAATDCDCWTQVFSGRFADYHNKQIRFAPSHLVQVTLVKNGETQHFRFSAQNGKRYRIEWSEKQHLIKVKKGCTKEHQKPQQSKSPLSQLPKPIVKETLPMPKAAVAEKPKSVQSIPIAPCDPQLLDLLRSLANSYQGLENAIRMVIRCEGLLDKAEQKANATDAFFNQTNKSALACRKTLLERVAEAHALSQKSKALAIQIQQLNGSHAVAPTQAEKDRIGKKIGEVKLERTFVDKAWVDAELSLPSLEKKCSETDAALLKAKSNKNISEQVLTQERKNLANAERNLQFLKKTFQSVQKQLDTLTQK